MDKLIMTFALTVFWLPAFSQDEPLPKTEDEFKKEILKLRTDVDRIQLNLHKSHQRFKVGIATATIGYTVTIAGGLLLANGNTDSGKALLITGGAIGITGTFLLVDSFKYLNRAAGSEYKKKE